MQGYVKILIAATRSKCNIPFQVETVDIAEFLADVKIQAKGLCAVKNIHLEWNDNSHTIQLAINKEQLIRAIDNIFSNAVEFTPIGGTITLTASNELEYLKISICDTGAGFSQEALNRATEQFYMSDNSRTYKTHYGIGLYIAQLIINKHHGQLILTNDAITGGAVVIMKIPYKG